MNQTLANSARNGEAWRVTVSAQVVSKTPEFRDCGNLVWVTIATLRVRIFGQAVGDGFLAKMLGSLARSPSEPTLVHFRGSVGGSFAAC